MKTLLLIVAILVAGALIPAGLFALIGASVGATTMEAYALVLGRGNWIVALFGYCTIEALVIGLALSHRSEVN